MFTLKPVLQANAASCIGFGVLFALKPEWLAVFLAPDAPAPSGLMMLLGLGLMVHGLHLLWASLQPQQSRLLVAYFCLGDVLWVLLTLGLVFSQTWVVSTKGVYWSLLVASVVGVLGALQWYCRGDNE